MDMIFCRGCGKEIHESAPTCPLCGAPQSSASSQKQMSLSSYNQVPWYRKNWFAIVCFFIFSPGLWIILLTGDVYYESKGQLKTYSKGVKIFLIVISLLAFLGEISKMLKDSNM